MKLIPLRPFPHTFRHHELDRPTPEMPGMHHPSTLNRKKLVSICIHDTYTDYIPTTRGGRKRQKTRCCCLCQRGVKNKCCLLSALNPLFSSFFCSPHLTLIHFLLMFYFMSFSLYYYHIKIIYLVKVPSSIARQDLFLLLSFIIPSSTINNLLVRLLFFSFSPHFYFPASGQAVVTQVSSLLPPN